MKHIYSAGIVTYIIENKERGQSRFWMRRISILWPKLVQVG